MKRRTFIVGACAAVVSIPLINYSLLWINQKNPLIYPAELSRFCDDQALREIGNRYRAIHPKENNIKSLNELLLTDPSGKTLKRDDREKVAELMYMKTFKDFSAYNTMIITGWVITTTEARQCALLSLT